ncbi:MAG: VWA domain-containing protein [Saprospiraceae bacterium]|nr:VWA domain-containing protein [Saprospiraceae bacterium]
MTEQPFSREVRWRLMLGQVAEEELVPLMEQAYIGMDESLEFLFDAGVHGDLQESLPRLHRWMGDIRAHFPAAALHILQKEAFDRLGLADMLLEPEIMGSLEPDIHLAGILMAAFQHLDEPRKAAARTLIKQVADQLIAKVKLPLLQALRGSRQRKHRRHSPPWPEIDWHLTIRKNLRYYQPDLSTLIPVHRVGYRQNQRRQQELIIVVDQSGSMKESLIYAGIYANVMAQLPSLRLTLLAFDIKVLNLTELMHDPVDLLLGFGLGGGTNIGNALRVAQTHVQSPAETVMVLISDLGENGSPTLLLSQVHAILQKGIRLICLLTLSPDGNPQYDVEFAGAFHKIGVPAFACSPDLFPEVMAAAFDGRPIPQK